MIFHDTQVDALDLTTSSGIQELVEVHLCGHPSATPLSPSDERLLKEFVEKAAPAGITFQQLNELLLVLNQDRVSLAFFNFFMSADQKPLPLIELRKGVVRFKGFAMVCFGNFRFAFRRLSTLASLDDLLSEMGQCCRAPEQVEAGYAARAEKILDVELIARENTWFVGELTGRLVADELRGFEAFRVAHPELENEDDAITFAKRLVEMDARFKSVQVTALRNTDVYLTWDHLDIYVATSMRNRWEYEDVFDFTQSLFAHPSLTPLKLRYFDPPQSKCATSRDKGLLEGLMLKRAVCTIYMAQETDTLGKDSELASTLAQGKPVIAYVPTIDVDKYAESISERPLRYAKLRLLDLQATGTLEEVDGLSRLTRQFLDDLSDHRKAQPFELWIERDTSAFKRVKPYWSDLCKRLAEAEKRAFEKRAVVLQKYHPLAMQMNLKTGVANGVLVVRSIDRCADLLRAILTNKAEFDIQVDADARILVERNSASAFRVVTGNAKLTNSFWNLWNL